MEDSRLSYAGSRILNGLYRTYLERVAKLIINKFNGLYVFQI